MRCTEWKCREIGNLLRSTSLIVFAKIDRWVKIESVIAIRVAIEEWGENEMAIGARCDAGGVLTKGWNKAQIGVCGFIREKVNVRNKYKRYLGGTPIACG